MNAILTEVANSPLLIFLCIAYFVSYSIDRGYPGYITANYRDPDKYVNQPDPLEWVVFFVLARWAVFILMAIMSWRVACVVFVVCFVFSMLHIPEIVGNILITLVIGRSDSSTDTSEEEDEARRRTAFMKKHKDMISVRVGQYLADHPDESLNEEVVDYVSDDCFLEYESAELEGKIAQAKQRVEDEITPESKGEKPFGNVTYEQASQYFRDYCTVMEEGVLFAEPESRLPTTVARMAEALKVECLHWCQGGIDFDEACDFMAIGIVFLSCFVPDDLADASADGMLELAKGSDIQEYEAVMAKRKMALDLQQRALPRLRLEWREFVEQYRDKYAK